MSPDDPTGPGPWDDALIPAGIDARRVYDYAVATGGTRRRRRRQRRVLAATACIAILGIAGAFATLGRGRSDGTVAVQPPTSDTTAVPGVTQPVTTTTIARAQVTPASTAQPVVGSAGPGSPPATSPTIIAAPPLPGPGAGPTTTTVRAPTPAPPNTPTTIRSAFAPINGTFVGGNAALACTTSSGCGSAASPGNELDVHLDGPATWTTIDKVCFTITYAKSNGLGAGDWLGWTQDGSGPGPIAPFLGTNPAVYTTTWCAGAPNQASWRTAFLDGHTRMKLHMLVGSATISAVSVTISGSPA